MGRVWQLQCLQRQPTDVELPGQAWRQIAACSAAPCASTCSTRSAAESCCRMRRYVFTVRKCHAVEWDPPTSYWTESVGTIDAMHVGNIGRRATH